MPWRNHRKGDKGDSVEMTSMVDVTFLLLIFFMVTASFSFQKSIQMPSQQTEDASLTANDPEAAPVTVHVDPRGSFYVMTPQWEQETLGKQQLTTALKRAAAETDDTPRLSVQVHELAQLRALVDVLDSGTTAGFAAVQVTQVDHLW